MATGHDIAMGLRAAYWSMHRQPNTRVARHRATAEQFVLLALLAERDGITQQELGRRASSDLVACCASLGAHRASLGRIWTPPPGT